VEPRRAGGRMMAVLDLRTEARPQKPELAPLDHLYGDVRKTWLGRMVNEHASAEVFDGLARQIRRAGLDEELARECEGFAAEERFHGVLCGAVVEAACGEARAPAPERDELPLHDDVAPHEALARNLMSVCCLSETAAVALIGAERLRMPEGSLRALMSRIYGDEVGHARFGWHLLSRLVPALDRDALERLGAYLALAFAHMEEHELAHLPAGSARRPRRPRGGSATPACATA
jgi:hypothetical protein